ncbi:MAG: hypothetical protein M3Q71_05385 [Chloroflexota bacterium]|nr:hypothetical protein [Chloroflexota bacterium]
MHEPFRMKQGNVQTARPQLALEILLHLYAFIGVVVLLRLLLRLLDINHRLWIGATIYRFTDVVARPLGRLPGGDREVIGGATLPDLTLVALLILLPLGAAALTDQRRRPLS